ncbi:MAG: GTPase domain-containing protein [Planctomycetota bacterium]
MAHVDLVRKEVSAKIVYYGPKLSGKTKNLESICAYSPEQTAQKVTPISTEEDQNLFYEFMPIDLGIMNGLRTRLQLYTVPGQIQYNNTRMLVLQNVDGIIFVADSQEERLKENQLSFKNLEENLRKYAVDLTNLSLLFQYNKRDLPNVLSVELLNETLNHWGYPFIEVVASQGIGVLPTLKMITNSIFEGIQKNRGTTRYFIR